MLNTCISFYFLQNKLMMHGSCVEKNNEQFIFLGSSGSEKSTMAMS